MAETAKDFNENAHTLERVMYWRNVKLNIVIGVLVGAILMYFVVPMFS